MYRIEYEIFSYTAICCIFLAYFLKIIWRIQLFVVPLHRQTRGKGQWTMDDGDEAARESQVDI